MAANSVFVWNMLDGRVTQSCKYNVHISMCASEGEREREEREREGEREGRREREREREGGGGERQRDFAYCYFSVLSWCHVLMLLWVFCFDDVKLYSRDIWYFDHCLCSVWHICCWCEFSCLLKTSQSVAVYLLPPCQCVVGCLLACFSPKPNAECISGIALLRWQKYAAALRQKLQIKLPISPVRI